MRALAAGLVLALLMTAGCSDKDGSGGDADGGATASGSVSAGAGGGGGGAGAGAGSSSSASATGSPGGGQEVSLAVAAVGAYPANPAFDPATASVPAGAVVHVTFSNDDLVPVVQHNWVVEGIAGASSDAIAAGEETTFDFTAPSEPGEFAFYCSIGDHRDRGMEGTLTVTA